MCLRRWSGFRGRSARPGRDGAAGRGRNLRRQPDRASEWGAVGAALRRARSRQGTSRPILTRWSDAERPRLHRHLSLIFSARASESRPERTMATKTIQENNPRLCPTARRRAETGSARCSAQARHRSPRPQHRAVHHRPCRDRALPRREGPPRAARLRGPDRQDARAAQQRRRPPGCITSSIAASIMC